MKLDLIEVKGQEIYIRPNTTDLNVAKEVFNNSYQNLKIGFTINKGENWLDLGANIGAFGLYVLNKGGEINCFEPEEDNFNVLKANIGGRGLLVRSAVSASKFDNLEFYRPIKPGQDSRITTIPNSRMEKIGECPNVYIGSIKAKFDGVKMDIEGSEFDIIDQDLIPKCNKLVLEYHFGKDRSIENFKRRIKILQKRFRTIHFMPSILKNEKTTGEFDVWYDRLIWCTNE